MRKVLAFILLLCHINGSMFLPQVAEKDTFDANGRQRDDINSIVEFVRVALGYDHTPDDEDDDDGQNLHLVKEFKFGNEQPYTIIEQHSLYHNYPVLHRLTGYIEPLIRPVFSDIITPPPDRA